MATILNPMPAGPTNESEISRFEAHIGHPLPADYRSFLLDYNGGHPDPDAFMLASDPVEQEDVVMCFFPMRDVSLGDVVVQRFEELRIWPIHCAWNDRQNDVVNLYEMELDEPLLPVGTDGSSSYFCIVLAGESRGSVVFFHHETAESVLLAKTFSTFLHTLRPRERTDYAPELG